MNEIIIKTKISAIIGLLEYEREKEQEIIINAKIKSYEFIDYAEVLKDITEIVQSGKFLKIEDALLNIEKYLKSNYKNLKKISLKIIKTQIISNSKVGVKLKMKY